MGELDTEEEINVSEIILEFKEDMAKNKTDDKLESLEQQLWKAADKLRKNIDAAEYKHVVLGLIFLKYISDAFEELYDKLKKGEGVYEGADPEDKDEYKAENVFFVPVAARWSFIRSKGKQPDIGKVIDDAMDAIEKENSSLKGVLPKIYARQNLDPTSLGGLIDLISNIALGDTKSKSADVLGHIFEYFLGQFALAEGKKGGQFYTPRNVVELLVEMLEPYEGRVFDPCCGSGGMFVQSEKFVAEHQGKINDISIYGQESNLTTWRLCKMNLAIRGIDSSQVKWNNEGSFLNDAHKDLKADYIIANPPFNISDWSGELIRNDGRWKFGNPPISNANYAWIQHFIYHLSPTGKAGFILADSSTSASSSEESSIRRNLVGNNLVDCIVSLPSHLFANTQIAVCIWFLKRDRKNSDDILFIDGSSLGQMVKRKSKILHESDINKIASSYQKWQKGEEAGEHQYKDIPGFCRAVTLGEVRENDFVLSPNRYITPIQQDIELNVDFENPKFISKYISLRNGILGQIDTLINAWNDDGLININNTISLVQYSKQLEELSRNLYEGLLKRYFLDFDLSIENYKDTPIGKIPSNWEIKTFEELFSERNEKVKDLGYCPPIYSVTNNGIQEREGKFSKTLSKSTQNYKVIHKGDMVFGLSREIPNLDVFKEEIGAVSQAYSVYQPIDYRVGMIVGGLMRLRLMEQVDLLKGGAREGRGLDKGKLMKKQFALPSDLDDISIWKE